MPERLEQAIALTRQHLLSLRNSAGHWEGELSSSALSTATAIVALHGVDSESHRHLIEAGVNWLIAHQNHDGGWGDTTISKSNLSTTLLCWSALRFCGPVDAIAAIGHAEAWITAQAGSLNPRDIAKAVIARYGKDKTFSVPILMLCAICGTLGPDGWRHVLPLPFELAALPRTWFGAIGLPVVSYALPALIAIGCTRFKNAPPPVWHPLRWLRALLWPRIRPMLRELQPSSGGYLEATPLTSFVTMALAAAGEKDHPCVPAAVGFLTSSMRADGSWPIDTNLATWGTTLAVKALWSGDDSSPEAAESRRLTGPPCLKWLLFQQYQTLHPFTQAAPGAWAWTDLPGGVPDADDTPGALIALHHLRAPVASAPNPDSEAHGGKSAATPAALAAAVVWLLDLQNRDGGMPTFCRGWGALPFDRSTPELTAHALLAWWLWIEEMPPALQSRIRAGTRRALAYLGKTQRADGAWVPLWFGNEHAPDEENPVYGTAQVVAYLSGQPALAAQARDLVAQGTGYLLHSQHPDGSWGGAAGTPPSIEETAVALHALCLAGNVDARAHKAVEWLLTATQGGTTFPCAPIGLYFARLWYHERLYPIVWTLQALQSAKAVLCSVSPPGKTTSP